MKPQIIIIDGRETLLQFIISDGLTFSLLALFIWISQGSNLWTFTTWMMGGFVSASICQGIGS